MNELRNAQEAALLQWCAENGIENPRSVVNNVNSFLGGNRGPISPDAVVRRLSKSMVSHGEAIAKLLNDVVSAEGAATEGALRQTPIAAVGATSPAIGSQPVVDAGAASAAVGEVLADHTDPDRLHALLDEFSPMDFSGAPEEPVQLMSRATEKGVEFRWRPMPEGPYRVYRLVSSDAGLSQTPDAAETLVVTTGRTFTDNRPMVTVVRHYQLWVNSGTDLEAAQWEQPAEIAQVSVIAPPQDIVVKVETIRCDDDGDSDRVVNNVIGQWSLLPGASRVQVYRIPAAQERVAGPANPAYRILGSDPCVGGFLDPDVGVGDHVYQFVVEAEVDQMSQLAAPVLRRLSVLPSREVIDDLECVDSGGGVTFDLSWSTPGTGRTIVFRTQKQPLSGTMGQDHPEDKLSHLGLPEGEVLVHPVSQEGTLSRMVNVALPDGWPRAYFTPVHVIGHEARIGRTVLRVQTAPVVGARIHQRVSRQIITFGWPAAADGTAAESQASGVNVFEAVPGTPAKVALTGTPLASANKASYDADGGIVLPRALRAEGSVVYLVPYAFAGRTPVPGPPTAVQYPGLLRISYGVKSSWKLGLKRRKKLEISVTADRHVPSAPRFMLVHNPDRLPLSTLDGTALPVYPEGAELAEANTVFRPSILSVTPSGESWVCDVEQPGYVRVFALLNSDQMASVAVLDPPVRNLQCMV